MRWVSHIPHTSMLYLSISPTGKILFPVLHSVLVFQRPSLIGLIVIFRFFRLPTPVGLTASWNKLSPLVFILLACMAGGGGSSLQKKCLVVVITLRFRSKCILQGGCWPKEKGFTSGLPSLNHFSRLLRHALWTLRVFLGHPPHNKIRKW